MALGLCSGEKLFALDESAGPQFPPERITVVAPEYRATIKGDTKIAVRAPGLAKVEATCWMEDRNMVVTPRSPRNR